ncbi:MAG: VOC family protein [Gemmatimonadales bacterium]
MNSGYVSIFRNSRIVTIARYGEAGPGRKGSVMTELEGQEFIALNGGPQFRFTEAISFSVNCKTQKEVDEFWEKRVMEAMLEMKKIDIAGLKKAYEQRDRDTVTERSTK